jgi:pSer/pThr/pTyr-binding forkhead associated (FHA) protein
MLCRITNSDCAPRYIDVYSLVTEQNKGGAIVVGRKARVAPAVSLQDPKVPQLISRKHATLEFDENHQLVLVDLGSANGTYYTRKNERTIIRLEPHVSTTLEVGSTIYFGGRAAVQAEDGTYHPNPFVFLYTTPAEPWNHHKVVSRFWAHLQTLQETGF